jgi:hypothetical protein
MHFAKAVAIFISGELASSMIDMFMAIPPDLQTGINTVFIRVNQCTGNNRVFNEGLNRLLFHIGQHFDHDLTTTLNHAKDGCPLFLQGASARFSFESASTTFASLLLHGLRIAFMPGHHIGFVALHLV